MALELCEELAEHYIRVRPTLPADARDTDQSCQPGDLPLRFPIFSCPFKGCTFESGSREDFERHLLGYYEESHANIVDQVCGRAFPWMTRLDYVHGAISGGERQHWPNAGLAVARRSLRRLAQVYNDDSVKCIVCFACAQQRVVMKCFDGLSDDFRSLAWLEAAEDKCPGTLLSNCSFDLWKARYVNDICIAGDVARGKEDNHLRLRLALEREHGVEDDFWREQWMLEMDIAGLGRHRLVGCTEDVYCISPAKTKGDSAR